MLRAFTGTLAALSLFVSLEAPASPLPRPQGLEPNVRLWTRIYSEIDTQSGLIHDSVHLDVVYETLRFPAGLSGRERERRIASAKRRYAAILSQLASGKRSSLSAESKRVLALWPAGSTNATLRTAAANVRFQLGQADKFRAGLIRAGQWRAHIEQVLSEQGVPTELVALPHVESSFNPRAYSHMGAAGLWQFMRSTGRIYMRIDDVVDERMDPHKASVSAARLLGSNYRQTESWPLAITAYNHGVGGMVRATRTLGTRDIATIVARYKSPSFGFASRNFYAEFLAASDIDRDPERFFGHLEPQPAIDYEVVVLDSYYRIGSLQRALGVNLETLRDHNLALRPPVWSGAKYVPRGYELRVPKHHVAQSVDQLLASIPPRERLAEQHRDRYYKVRRGDTLSTIASRLRVSQTELKTLNNLRDRNTIRMGQVLRLPDHAGASEPAVLARVEPMPSDRIHRVRRGETLSSIGKRYGVTEGAIVAANRLRSRNVIMVGQRLRLPGGPEPLAAPAPPTAATVVVAQVEAPPDASAVTPPAPALDPETPPATTASTPADSAERAAEIDDPAAAPTADAKPKETSESPPPNSPAPVTPAPITIAAASPVPTPPAAAVTKPLAGSATAPAPALAESSATPAPDPSNYAVSRGDRITVQAEETLGHYAEWLEVRPSVLRRLNGMKSGAVVQIGRSAKVDFSRVTPEVFERRRLKYHLALQEAFFEAYLVSATEPHVLKRGETLWFLAQHKFKVPVWLLRQYNPDLDFAALRPGTQMVIPIVEPRQA